MPPGAPGYAVATTLPQMGDNRAGREAVDESHSAPKLEQACSATATRRASQARRLTNRHRTQRGGGG